LFLYALVHEALRKGDGAEVSAKQKLAIAMSIPNTNAWRGR
jgi:hypothetical protein